jgi:glyceraldehyde-3-phosphate dehydrogenase/erythrose-4-phosphate dehydrogenase
VSDVCDEHLAWYDNEIGYVHRMIELAEKIGAALGAAA